MKEKRRLQLQEELIELVPRMLLYGHENARTRSEIVAASGLNDRAVREIIEAARDAGWLVCNDQDGRGYYLAWTDEEIRRQYWRQKSRMVSIWNAMHPFYERLKEAGLET